MRSQFSLVGPELISCYCRSEICKIILEACFYVCYFSRRTKILGDENATVLLQDQNIEGVCVLVRKKCRI